MNDEVELILEDAEEKMQRTTNHLDTELQNIRAGRASVNMLDGIQVDYYGSMTPLNQVANVNTPDARTLAIQPWEKTMIDPIEKAILAANIGLTPMNNGEIIRINIPMLTEQRRQDLVKQVKNEGENSKVSVRNIRRDANEHLKKLLKEGLSEDLEKDAELSIQELTDNFIKEIEDKIVIKEKDIMTI
ncbi:MAG: ribosome recycling factor [Bacteroidetes bacterium]|jgi:ribosome recycling factor|nr:ribosome recycling factor [Bacteroidota bacterium]MBT3747900.1 ribosome recycling factor [Bacteroidota bacterium]MBT4402244.1 ribosome recycling factor [Bacteroidota bacterium]MBT4410448.1 ribosome recycling factor [Bacteroidota bacterium]MBT5427069.1 ribosome recycling factor [Bacteroidota bacterium]